MRGRRSDRRGDLLQLRRPALFLFAVLRYDNSAVRYYSVDLHTEYNLRELL